jgi:hypothetical protein
MTGIDYPCIHNEICHGLVTLRFWTDRRPPYDRRKNADAFNQVTLAKQTCFCSLSDEDIERLGIFARCLL